jgi:hypothetical protein
MAHMPSPDRGEGLKNEVHSEKTPETASPSPIEEATNELRDALSGILMVCQGKQSTIKNGDDFRERLNEVENQTSKEQIILLQIYRAFKQVETKPALIPIICDLASILLEAFKNPEIRPVLSESLAGLNPEILIQIASRRHEEVQKKDHQRMAAEMLGDTHPAKRVKTTGELQVEIEYIHEKTTAEIKILQVLTAATEQAKDDPLFDLASRILTLFYHTENRQKLTEYLQHITPAELRDMASELVAVQRSPSGRLKMEEVQELLKEGQINASQNPEMARKIPSRRVAKPRQADTGRVNFDFVESALKAAKEAGGSSSHHVEKEAPYLLQFEIQQIEKEISRIDSPAEEGTEKSKTKLKEEMKFVVLQTLRKILSLLQKIGINSSRIPEARAKRAAYYAQQSLASIKRLVKRAEENSRFAYFDLPDTIRRSIGQMRAIANNVTVGSKEEIQQMKQAFPVEDSHAKLVLDTLATLFSESKKWDKKKMTNISAEELVGDLLETPQDERDEEWTEYLMIHAAGGLVDFELDKNGLEMLEKKAEKEEGNFIATDAIKIRMVRDALENLEKFLESNPKNKLVSITRARTYANGLIARMALTPKQEKQYSTFERFFSRYLVNIEISFRVMNYITERSMERSTTKMVQFMKSDTSSTTEEVAPEQDEMFTDDWLK